jgi:thiamine biosynthesis protein ThiI
MVVLIVRYGEVTIKGLSTRSRMEKLLMRNIVVGLRSMGIETRVRRGQGRLFVEIPGDKIRESIDLISRVFGVKSVSPAKVYGFSNLNDLVGIAVKEWSELVRGRTFAVRVRRVGNHPFTSIDVARVVGAALIRGNNAYLFTEIVKGPGGLPLGSEGRLLALISGGFDSPVAAWFMMKRGVYVDALFCSLAYPVDVINFLRVSNALFSKWSIGYDPRLFILDCSQLINEFRERANPHIWSVLFKRFLYEVGARVAKSVNALGLVTGESLGQVSSQTLHNLMAIEYGIDMPIYRPLIGLDSH